MVRVHYDSWLRTFGPTKDDELHAATVRLLLDAIEEKYPRMRFKLRDETGAIRKFVRIFVDEEDVSGTTGVETPLVGARTIDILHSIAGG